MLRKLFLFAGLAVVSAASAQTYWVNSATVTHSSGWPSVHVNTRSGRSNGYTWDVTTGGGLLSPGGLQSDGTHSIVDGNYWMQGDVNVYGLATASGQSYQMHRTDITITFTIRCSYTSTPPTPGAPVFAIRCEADTFVDAGDPDHAIATAFYIPPGGTLVQSWTSESQKPGGLEFDQPGYVAHRNETGTAPGGWTSVGTNLWETTVTVPVPIPADYPDEDLYVFGAASGSISGSMLTAWSHAYDTYEYRCISLGGITLQPGF